MFFRILSALIIAVTLCFSNAFAFDPTLTTNECDYVILTHDNFYTQALRLHNHRNVSLRSCLVKTSEVLIPAFNGANDVETIRNFILFAYSNWKIAPTYLMLIGDANLHLADPPEDIDASNLNFLPAKVTTNPYNGWGSDYDFMEDGWYVNSPIAGQIKPIMHIGRIPGRTNTQISNAIDKIITYDGITGNPAWLSKVLMLVGDANINAYNEAFTELNDQLYDLEYAQWVPTPTTVYSSDYFEVPSREEVMTEYIGDLWDSGYGFINGLGNTSHFTSFVLSIDIDPYWLDPDSTFVKDVLAPTNKFPVVFGATCYTNPYWANLSYTDGISVGEDFLLGASDRGAIGVIGAAHINDAIDTYILDQLFSHALLTDGIRNMGRLFSLAKAKFLEENMGLEILGREYTLLGDPAVDLKIHPVPLMTKFTNGAEIEDAPLLQNHVVGKSSGITSENSRVVHEENIAGFVEPLIPDRMFRVKATDSAGGADYIEWMIQDNLNINITSNMHLSFWINIVNSPSGNDKVILDGNTTGGRIKDNIFITDQNGVPLDAKYRTGMPAGWQLVYADLSPLEGETLEDLRIRYETTIGTESGDLLAYFDDIRIGRNRSGFSEEILNYSFEEDNDENGVPDFWTNLLGQTTCPQVIYRDDAATHGTHSMEVYDIWCNSEGAQHIFFTNEDIQQYHFEFRYYAPDPTTFTVTLYDIANGTAVFSQQVNADADWGYFSMGVDNPSFGFGSSRMKLQIIPDDCFYPVFIDEVWLYQPIVTAVDDLPNYLKSDVKAYPNPFNPSTMISYSVPKTGKVKLSVYDIRGRLIKVLFEGTVEKGNYKQTWYGKDSRGQRVASGIYLVNLQTKDGTTQQKVTLVK